MPNEPMLSTQQSVEAVNRAVDLYTFSATGAAIAFSACRGIMCNVAGTYKLYFRNAPSTAITMILVAGLVYPFVWSR